ncbi:MAG: coiled-coil domain-containing protein [Methylocella sp.]
MQAPFDRNMPRIDFQPSGSHTAAMNAILFDTLRLSRTLRDKGHFTPEQAEALAEALGEAAQGDLATNADLVAAKSELKTEIGDLRMALKTEIADLRVELKTEIADLRMELKTEIAELRMELKTEIADLRTEFKTEIAGTKTDLLKWIIGAIGFQTVVILGAVVSLARVFAK